MSTQEQPADSGEKMYTRWEIHEGVKDELGIDYIHFNIPDKLYTEKEYQDFIEYSKRLMDFGDDKLSTE